MLTGHGQYPNNGASHRVSDTYVGGARSDASSRLRQRGRRQHVDTHHARELHLNTEVQHYEEHEKGISNILCNGFLHFAVILQSGFPCLLESPGFLFFKIPGPGDVLEIEV